jgi:hypothetical protein
MNTTELLDGWVDQEVVAYVLAPGGEPTAAAPEGEAGRLAYPLGVGPHMGVLKGHDERGLIVESGGNVVTGTAGELYVLPWAAILVLKLAR